MLIAQISDLHVAARGSDDDKRFATADHLSRAVTHINGLDPQPDLLIASGDLVAHGSVEEYELLSELLGPLRTPVYLMCGNHDDRAHLRREFGDHAYLFEGGEFISYVLDMGPFRIVALDTQLAGKARGQVCAQRAEWLDRTLSSAPEKPVILFMHHPPLRTGIDHMDRSRIEDARALAEVVARHRSIQRIACGHVHRSIQFAWCGIPVSVAPSAAYQMALTLGGERPAEVIFEPPALLLHYWLDEEATFVTHQSCIQTTQKPQPLYPDQGT